MNKKTKTILTVAALAVGAYALYQWNKKRQADKAAAAAAASTAAPIASATPAPWTATPSITTAKAGVAAAQEWDNNLSVRS